MDRQPIEIGDIIRFKKGNKEFVGQYGDYIQDKMLVWIREPEIMSGFEVIDG